MIIMVLRAVFFDLDNTLINYAGYKLRTAIAAAEELVSRGFPDTVENIVRKMFFVYDRNGMEHEKTLHDVIIQYGLPIRDGEMYQQAALIAYNREKYSRGITPYPDAMETLMALRRMGLKIAVISDGPRNKVYQRLILSGMDRMFDGIITRDDAGQAKPHRKPFERALRKTHVRAEEAMMVGDIVTKDMYGARRLGITTCHAVFGEKDRKKYEGMGGIVKKERAELIVKPDFRIECLKDLPPLVARLMK